MSRKWKRILIISSSVIVAVSLLSCLRMDQVVREKFEGKKWKLPSLVYGRPLELYPGLALDQDSLEQELAELRYSRQSQANGPGTYQVQGNVMTIYRRGFTFWDRQEDATKLELYFQNRELTRIHQDDEPAALVRLEPLLLGGIYPDRFEDRTLIRLDQAPTHLIDALILTEDHGFYDHFGIQPKAIARAMIANIKAGGYVQGASTLTQQLVKNFYLSSDRTIKRKLIEAIYAVLLELHYSKDQILEAYLNEVYLGQQGDRAIHGFGLASEFYFGIPVQKLNPAQSALLVGIVNGPSYYNPRRYPDRCRQKRDQILTKMLEHGTIDEAMYRQALKQDLGIQPNPRTQSLLFPAYLDLVKRHLSRDYRDEDLKQEGLRIFTAFDPQVQWAAEEALSKFLRGAQHVEGAVVVASSAADVEAVVGGRQAGFAGFNRALDAKRPIGSLVKPATLLAALQEGKNYQLTTRIDDSPVSLKLANGKLWEPQNFDKDSHGQVPLYEILAKSYNQASARLGLELGTDRVAEVLAKLGGMPVDSIPKNPAMLLGSVEMTPFQVTEIYQTISSGGFRRPLRSVRYVMTSAGDSLKSYPPETKKVIDSGLIHLIQYALISVMREGTGRSAYAHFPYDFLIAGKTGTSDERRDSWFAGYSGDKLAVVWVGRDDNQPSPFTGSSGSLQVWSRFMKRVSHQSIHMTKPQNIVYQWIEEASGKTSFEICQGVRQIPFIEGTEPGELAPCIKSLQPVVDWFKKFFEQNN